METPVTEVMSVGSFDWDRGTVASTDAIEVERNTLYHFVFWLNGGDAEQGILMRRKVQVLSKNSS